MYERKTLLIALTQGVRYRPIDADSEIGNLDLSRRFASNTRSAADAPDLVHVRLTASACKNVDRLVDHRIHTRSRKVADRPLGVLEDLMEDGCVHRGRCRVGTERHRDVDAMSDEQAARGAAALSIRSCSDRYGISKFHGLTLSRLRVPKERGSRAFGATRGTLARTRTRAEGYPTPSSNASRWCLSRIDS